jgi:hypothetical protein
MCLSVREQRQLDTIGEAVSRSDARLASLLAAFGRLTAGAPMPEREQLAALPSRGGAALHAAAAAVARAVAWLDRLDSPRASHERPGEHRHRAA